MVNSVYTRRYSVAPNPLACPVRGASITTNGAVSAPVLQAACAMRIHGGPMAPVCSSQIGLFTRAPSTLPAREAGIVGSVLLLFAMGMHFPALTCSFPGGTEHGQLILYGLAPTQLNGAVGKHMQAAHGQAAAAAVALDMPVMIAMAREKVTSILGPELAAMLVVLASHRLIDTFSTVGGPVKSVSMAISGPARLIAELRCHVDFDMPSLPLINLVDGRGHVCMGKPCIAMQTAPSDRFAQDTALVPGADGLGKHALYVRFTTHSGTTGNAPPAAAMDAVAACLMHAYLTMGMQGAGDNPNELHARMVTLLQSPFAIALCWLRQPFALTAHQVADVRANHPSVDPRTISVILCPNEDVVNFMKAAGHLTLCAGPHCLTIETIGHLRPSNFTTECIERTVSFVPSDARFEETNGVTRFRTAMGTTASCSQLVVAVNEFRSRIPGLLRLVKALARLHALHINFILPPTMTTINVVDYKGNEADLAEVTDEEILLYLFGTMDGQFTPITGLLSSRSPLEEPMYHINRLTFACADDASRTLLLLLCMKDPLPSIFTGGPAFELHGVNLYAMLPYTAEGPGQVLTRSSIVHVGDDHLNLKHPLAPTLVALAITNQLPFSTFLGADTVPTALNCPRMAPIRDELPRMAFRLYTYEAPVEEEPAINDDDMAVENVDGAVALFPNLYDDE